MVREDQVDAAGMNVDGFAEVFQGHHGALDVPAGTAGAERRIPGNFALLGCLPEREIAGVRLFVLIHIDARTGDIAAEVAVRELAVAGEGGNPEVSGTFARVSVVAGGQPLDGIDHVADVLGGGSDLLGALQAQRRTVVQEGLGVDRGVFVEAFMLGGGVADDFIVHVGDVHDVVKPESAGAEPPAQDIEESERPEIADVGVGVDGGAAGVHADGVVPLGRKGLDLLRECVVEAERHDLKNTHRSRGFERGRPAA